MPKDQTSNTSPEPRFHNQRLDLPGSGDRRRREGGKKARHGRATNDRVERMAGQTVEPVLSAPFAQGPIGQPPPTNPGQALFERAQNFRMRDVIVTNTVNPPPNPDKVDGWKLLVKHISPNALHNSSARYDAPKCDEDTRVELTRELMDRIGDRGNPQRLLCMTGAAGSGKSAIQQTITGLCADSGILGSAYFFSSADPTRNTVSAVVPTIAFQLGSHNRDLQQAISAVVTHDPVIFERSLQAQMEGLLVRPMRHIGGCARPDIAALPHAILIDGLDECKDEDRQEELLTALRECLLPNEVRFCIFIASRPEWAIRTALEPGGHLHAVAYHIQLSDQYDASADMHRFLRRRFEQLSVRARNPHWFTERNIETLVQAGSGQFIYVATVYRYISERRASPAERLKAVLTWTPHGGQTTRPFEALDRVYTNILLHAKNAYEAVDTHSGRDFLLLFRIHHLNVVSGFSHPGTTTNDKATFQLFERELTRYLGLEADSLEILISDLHSVLSTSTQMTNFSGSYMHILHKSFSDFLDAESRAGDMFVPTSRVYTHLAKCCLLHIIQSPDSDFLPHAAYSLPLFWGTESVRLEDEIIVDFTRKGGWRKIDSLGPMYKGQYRIILPQLDRLTEGLKSRNPEVVKVMGTFFKKWQREHKDFATASGCKPETLSCL